MPAKIILSQKQLDQIKTLFERHIGARKIAKILGISRWMVQQGYKKLGTYNIGRKTPCTIDFDSIVELKCVQCSSVKNVSQFRKRICVRKNGHIRKSYESYCLNCERYLQNENAKRRAKIRRQTDPNFVIRRSVSYAIWRGLKSAGSSKGGRSCLQFLPYTIDQLKQHLENLFEPWMNWDNHGNYNAEIWNDNDPNTWTWQIDHIIPQSDLPYISMEDENFRRCWDLNNLRPLSAKLNNLDGTRKIRHKS